MLGKNKKLLNRKPKKVNKNKKTLEINIPKSFILFVFANNRLNRLMGINRKNIIFRFCVKLILKVPAFFLKFFQRFYYPYG